MLKHIARAVSLALTLTGMGVVGLRLAPLESTAAATTPPTGPTSDEKERFLATAEIVTSRILGEGTTKSTRATLSDGKLRHDAHIQTIDIYKPVWRGKTGTVEKDKLLGLNMVPPTVIRDYQGKPASYTWWVDDVWLTEMQRRDRKIPVPQDQGWVNRLNIVRMFDQLIHNTDRNQGNLLIMKDWKVVMIDHTRAFRTSKTLLNPAALTRIDYKLFRTLKALDPERVRTEMADCLTPEETEGLLARRDAIVAFYESEIKEKGEVSVLTDMPRATPQVSVP
jgi:hypothetical protein